MTFKNQSQAHPLASVVILNWNGASYLPRCLQALYSQTGVSSCEVLVIDNGSSDGSADDLEARWSGVRVERLRQNIGFAAGNNLGARLARGEWLVLLNADAFPTGDWLNRLLEAAGQHPNYDCLASHIISAQDPHLVDSTGDLYHTSGLAWSRDRGLPAEVLSSRPCGEVFSPQGAAACYRREAFLAAGGFDEDYFSNFEDVDLGFRLRLRGSRCLYVPEAVVAHLGSAAQQVESRFSIYHVQRNLVWTYWKNMPAWLFWRYMPSHLFANLVMLAYYIWKGQTRAVIGAKWDALRGLPQALRKRRLIQAERRISIGELDRQLEHGLAAPYWLGKRRRRWHQKAAGLNESE